MKPIPILTLILALLASTTAVGAEPTKPKPTKPPTTAAKPFSGGMSERRAAELARTRERQKQIARARAARTGRNNAAIRAQNRAADHPAPLDPEAAAIAQDAYRRRAADEARIKAKNDATEEFLKQRRFLQAPR